MNIYKQITEKNAYEIAYNFCNEIVMISKDLDWSSYENAAVFSFNSIRASLGLGLMEKETESNFRSGCQKAHYYK